LLTIVGTAEINCIEVEAAVHLEIWDYVKLGKYCDEPIVWRVTNYIL